MTKVYALFNSKGKIVNIGLKMEETTNFLVDKISDDDWNTWFMTDTPEEEMKILTKYGYYIKIGEFKEIRKGRQ